MSWTHLSDTTPKARKQYRCDICNEVIQEGEKHVSRRGAGEGRMVTMRMHFDCEELSKSWDQMEWECHCTGDCTRQEVRDALARKVNSGDGRTDEGGSVNSLVEPDSPNTAYVDFVEKVKRNPLKYPKLLNATEHRQGTQSGGSGGCGGAE